MAVELGLPKPVPLHAEAVGVVRFGHKTRDGLPDWVAVPAVLRDQPAGLNLPVEVVGFFQDEWLASLRATQDCK